MKKLIPQLDWGGAEGTAYVLESWGEIHTHTRKACRTRSYRSLALIHSSYTVRLSLPHDARCIQVRAREQRDCRRAVSHPSCVSPPCPQCETTVKCPFVLSPQSEHPPVSLTYPSLTDSLNSLNSPNSPPTPSFSTPPTPPPHRAAALPSGISRLLA